MGYLQSLVFTRSIFEEFVYENISVLAIITKNFTSAMEHLYLGKALKTPMLVCLKRKALLPFARHY